MRAALRPWAGQLQRERQLKWGIRAAIGALLLGGLVLSVGWFTPRPEAELRPWAAELTAAVWLAAVLVTLWPGGSRAVAAELDRRLGLEDRLATAWTYRASDESIVRLQRNDALLRLARRDRARDLNWRPPRIELGLLAASAIGSLLLLILPSPQQLVLDRQAAEQTSVQQATDRLEALRQAAIEPAGTLTPDQAQRLNELLQQTQAQLSQVRTQREATAILASAENQLSQQLADPNAELRDEALAAMSETLAAEPMARRLGDALQREDPRAASQALEALADQVDNRSAAQSDKLTDIQRQALSRALQRAANVGRSAAASSSALREAARAVAAGEPASAAMSAADAALREALQASTAQASLRATTQQLRDLQAQLARGSLPRADDPTTSIMSGGQSAAVTSAAGAAGTPVALDPSRGVGLSDLAERGPNAGTGAAGLNADQPAGSAVDPAAENVFVPGRAGDGPADQSLTEQSFSVRGAPRPYRDVLGQYAQSGRDYVSRPDISPAVRDLVKQYFQQLEQGQ